MALYQDGYQRWAAQAWVKFNSGGGIHDDRNISSVSDNGTGKFTVYIDNNLNSSHYGVCADGKRQQDVGNNEASFNSSISNESSSSFKVGSQDNNSDGYSDPTWVSCIVVR
ncbi:predicted protein [Cyanophage NATL2A-133]|uniref:Predicted protein n=1 Tax=Cyanophage NATL2A-133 TaxID=445692 RepID=E3SP36_9CAUD|nr:hypothetical protein CYPG_00013 [Cyanophage NATL2A-133]ADP00153.1 predicted protein [Cyanophage NATL2A-133]